MKVGDSLYYKLNHVLDRCCLLYTSPQLGRIHGVAVKQLRFRLHVHRVGPPLEERIHPEVTVIPNHIISNTVVPYGIIGGIKHLKAPLQQVVELDFISLIVSP